MDRIITYMDLVNLNIPNKEQVADEILSLPEDDWYWIKFHGAWMCSLYNARPDVGWFEQFSFNPNLAEDSASVTALRDYIFPCICLLYTSPSPRDATLSRMPSSA